MPFSRKLTPHALVYDGQRWHVRAYCHTRQDFRDFLISRILEIEGTESDHSRASEDSEWNNLVSVELSPHPALPEPQRRAIELDYGMVGGICKFQCREALLFYVLRQLRLDQPETSPPRHSRSFWQTGRSLNRCCRKQEFADSASVRVPRGLWR